MGDRVTLTLKVLRTGKLSLARNAKASADTFVVEKRSGSRLREIWNGSRLTAAAVPFLKPPRQACPASLGTLEASEDRPQWISCRDGKVFFDQLSVPVSLRAFLGRLWLLLRICFTHRGVSLELSAPMDLALPSWRVS